jgi:hypothetical protein
MGIPRSTTLGRMNESAHQKADRNSLRGRGNAGKDYWEPYLKTHAYMQGPNLSPVQGVSKFQTLLFSSSDS